jgi:ankyrin repeat protein
MNTSHGNNFRPTFSDLIALVLVILLQCACLAGPQSSTQNAQDKSSNTKPVDCASPTPLENVETMPEWQGSDLHKAISRQDLAGFRNLLNQNANTNAKDNYGNAPLFYAAGLTIKEPNTRTAEIERREREKEAQFKITAVEELLKHGADPNLRGAHKATPMIKAASGGFGPRHTVQILSLLIGYQADVNLRDERGYSALMTAAQTGSPEVVKFLLEHDADATLANCDGKTAILIAQALNHTEVVRILQSAK